MNTITVKASKVARHAAQYRTWLRVKAGAAGYNCRIVVLDASSQSPTFEGDVCHYTNRSGERIHHPAAYAKKGFSSIVYVCSTRRVEVGSEWLKVNGISVAAISA